MMALLALPLARASTESLTAVYSRTFEKAAFGFAKMYVFCLFMRVLLSWFPGIDWNAQPWTFLRLVRGRASSLRTLKRASLLQLQLLLQLLLLRPACCALNASCRGRKCQRPNRSLTPATACLPPSPQITEPYLQIYRGILPPLFGQLDFTPLFGFLILQVGRVHFLACLCSDCKGSCLAACSCQGAAPRCLLLRPTPLPVESDASAC